MDASTSVDVPAAEVLTGETDPAHVPTLMAGLLPWLAEIGALPHWHWHPEFLPLREPIGRDWGDSPEAQALREQWDSELWDLIIRRINVPEAWKIAAAKLAGVDVGVVKIAVDLGKITFAEGKGIPCLLLLSDCRRRAELFRLDGAPWLQPSGFTAGRALPGSLDRVPFGPTSFGGDANTLLVVGPSLAYLSVFGLFVEAHEHDCAFLAISSPEFEICRGLLKELRGHRVRLAFPSGEAWDRTRAEWSAILAAAGCEVDTFDWSPHSCRDAIGFAKLPAESRQTANLIPSKP